MFKVGDKVRCVETGYSKHLNVGDVYTVSELRTMGCIRVREIDRPHSYFSYKFVKVEKFKGNK